jgi:hypothetical protein
MEISLRRRKKMTEKACKYVTFNLFCQEMKEGKKEKA